MAAAASQGREQDWARFVYVTRFGSHQCGGVLQLGGRQAQGLWGRESRAGCCQEKPTEATAVPGVPGGGELPPGSRLRVPAAPGVAVAASASSPSSQLQTSSGRSSTRPLASAGVLAGRACDTTGRHLVARGRVGAAFLSGAVASTHGAKEKACNSQGSAVAGTGT
ncbi:hypothetical protein P7K49_005455 [Saguinus oedipus]|uniref:Uncharacterized protein n=1 Tax=Saguinus oedipus TaxID=9490 RepID=A0ABQ9WCQ5_SAGOE|nr:hypothetical protein P7K49_005455 [Saguinus oedipus]